MCEAPSTNARLNVDHPDVIFPLTELDMANYVLNGILIFMLLLFALSGLCIFIWIFNWPIFAFAGTPIIGLLASCAYVWLCVTYQDTIILWFDDQKRMFASKKTSGPVEISHHRSREVALDELMNKLATDRSR